MAATLWHRAVAILTSIYVLRMLGMFMIFPVFSLYATRLEGATPALVGVALGVYGLTQAMLQIPYGKLSDRFGRRPLIVVGLGLFIVGSVIAAMADSITVMIIGRTIQGMGAISAVTLAFATDVVPKERLSTVMAIIGGSIGMAFVLSLIIGPLIAHWIGVDGLFWLIAGMTTLALISVYFLHDSRGHSASDSEHTAANIDKRGLWQASAAVFVLHGVFSATFLVLPFLLVGEGLDKSVHWWVYLPANIIAMAFMRVKATPHPLNFAISFIILAIGLALMTQGFSLWGLGIAVTVYFIAFYRLETGLPHWVANVADPQSRGQAMGIFSTAQFGGSFIGASLAGVLWQQMNSEFSVLMALLVCTAIAALALLFIGKKATLNKH
ncbi:MFS transporter [Suttonella sp. R2A3]|uniref:MFS transporter n=1 Tax=Suttonella sp. R2A3 TaxID=2908648 RepID=UPI001F1C1DE0|nr:MFS transporter [Suttonella sp. R2A3]UJF24576.1 MFS transporter [Suttonella sp. R2A3]